MKRLRILVLLLLLTGTVSNCMAVESGMYRLLSISETEKLILVSRIPDKTKYLLDVAAAKITVGGKPAEIGELESYSLIQVKWKKEEDKRNGVKLDGIAVEIQVDPPDKPE
jgi:hypothetical protein